ncbi:MAG: NAD(P)/FAD-dependent oxidoreductase [Synechococcaceae cyanobacterium SM2_3_1]|nr:NAD(P)/FAD-dependent oxidoreductase [Synechococcaceae cyanobacterium SM2_3_1]
MRTAESTQVNRPSPSLRVVVIGGGAAGCFGAITCAQSHPHTRVTLLEAGPHFLSKVRISGGGRCNVTHACFDPALLVQHYPRGGQALRGPFTRFQPRDTVAWFAHAGVKLKTEADGRMFPVTDDSATVVDCLIQAATQAGVQLRSHSPVTQVEPQDQQFKIQLKTGETLICERLLLATGSSPQGHRLARGLGHTLIPPAPSLFTFNIPDPTLHQLAGVSVEQAHLRLQVGSERLEQVGPLLITHWGLSGPAVLKLSAWGARFLQAHRYQASLRINWLSGMSQDQLRQHLLRAKSNTPRRQVRSHSPLPLSLRLWQYCCDQADLDLVLRWADLSKQAMQRLLMVLTQSDFQITGKGVFKEEFVTAGGVDLRQVDTRTMSSRLCGGLYFAGEILDIDGVTGGFNFQAAWTTAWIAGQALGQSNLSS